MTTATPKQYAKRMRTEVEKVRERIRALQEQVEQVETAPVPRAEAIERVRAFLDGETSRYQASLSIAPFLSPGRHPIKADLFLPALARTPTSGADGWKTVVEAAICTVAAGAVEKILVAAIDEALADRKPGLPGDQRGPRLAELRAELLKAELEEEDAIRAAEAEGVAVDRRADADPLVVLGLIEAAA